jgi:hypothetical protein
VDDDLILLVVIALQVGGPFNAIRRQTIVIRNYRKTACNTSDCCSPGPPWGQYLGIDAGSPGSTGATAGSPSPLGQFSRDSASTRRMPPRARADARRPRAPFHPGLRGAHRPQRGRLGTRIPGERGAARRLLGNGARSSPAQACRLPRGLRRHLPLRAALEVHFARHRRLLGEDRGPLLHLQLRDGRDPAGPDAWFYPYASTQYYSFQHYGAALMGRLLSIPTGETYNVGFCLLIALGGTAFAGAVFLAPGSSGCARSSSRLRRRRDGDDAPRPPDRQRTSNPWTSMRFIGSAPMDKAPVGHLAQGLPVEVPAPGAPGRALLLLHLPRRLPRAALRLLPDGPLRDVDAALVEAPPAALRRHRRLHAHLDRPRQHMGPAAPGDGDRRVAPRNWRDWRRLVPGGRRGRGGRLAGGLGLPVGFTASAAGYNAALRMVPWEGAHAAAPPPHLHAPDGGPHRSSGSSPGSVEGAGSRCCGSGSSFSRSTSTWMMCIRECTTGSTRRSSGGRGSPRGR